MAKLFSYQPSMPVHVNLPQMAQTQAPPNVEANGQKVLRHGLENAGRGLEIIARDYSRFQNCQVEDAVDAVARQYEDFKAEYMRSHTGSNALNAQADLTARYDYLAKEAIEKFGSSEREVFKHQLRKKLYARGLMAVRDGASYQAQQRKTWEQSVWDGKMEMFQQACSENAADPDRLDYMRKELLEYYQNVNPGLDYTAIEHGLREKQEITRAQAFISQKNWDSAQDVLAGSRWAYNGKLGSATRQEESGGEGVLAVGHDKNGGTSFGSYQLSSRQGSYQEWLRYLESKGGEAASIARELKAAGPLDTGSRKGAAVDAYKRLAKANPELFEQTQHEYIFKTHYSKALNNAPKAMRQMVEADPSLAEMVWSTAVQHGAAGAAKIFNETFREGMGREDLIDAVYKRRADYFPGSTPDVRESVRRRFMRESSLIKTLPMAGGIEPVRQMQLQHQIETGRKQEMHERQAAMAPVLENWLAQCEDGQLTDLPYSNDEIAVTFGETAPELIKKIESARNYSASLAIAKYMNATEQKTLLNDMKPRTGSADYHSKKTIHDKLAQAVQQMQTAWNNDAAAWLIENDDGVGKARQIFLASPSSVTFQDWQIKLQSAKKLRGIETPQLFSKADAAAFAAVLESSPNPCKNLQQWQSCFGSAFPQAMTEIMPKTSVRMNILANNVPENAVKLLMQAGKDKDFSKNASEILGGKGFDKNAFAKKVHEEIWDFTATLTAGGNNELATGYAQAVSDLALQYMLGSGYATEPDKAIERAADELFGNNYEIARNRNSANPFRIPKRAGMPEFIENGAAAWLAKAELANFTYIPNQKFNSEKDRMMAQSVIRNEGYWITNQDETGLQLFVGSQPVLNDKGYPVNLDWATIASFGKAPVQLSMVNEPEESEYEGMW